MKLYQYSMQQYQHLLDQENILKYNLENNKAYGQGKGREIAAIISMTTSFIIVMVTLFVLVKD